MSDKASQEQRLTDATAAARTSPDKDEHWNELEQLAATLQRPEDVAAVYRDVLATELPPALIARLGLRAVRFHDEWFGGDDSALVDVLSRILAVSPAEESALSRLTVVLTVTARWLDLLAVYDRALVATQDAGRKVRMLEEAIQVAKDFAAEPDRAIGYMQQLVVLKPGDAQLASSLERLLERRNRWADLIELWTARAEELPVEAALTLRERIATTHLERIGDRAAALAAATTLGAAGKAGGGSAGEAARDGAARILEQILADDEAPRAVRLAALGELAAAYDDRGRAEEVIRCIDVALGFAEPAERITLHTDASARLAAAGRPDLAIEHLAAWLALAPGAVEAHDELRGLVDQTGAHARYVDALLAAASSPAGASRRPVLLVEAADVRAERLADPAGAIALYQEVLAEPAPGDAPRSRRTTGPVNGADLAIALPVVRRLEALLEAAGRREEQLAVLERIAELHVTVHAQRRSGAAGSRTTPPTSRRSTRSRRSSRRASAGKS
jgi:tetratricopeptide (TPR) repeat protein